VTWSAPIPESAFCGYSKAKSRVEGGKVKGTKVKGGKVKLVCGDFGGMLQSVWKVLRNILKIHQLMGWDFFTFQLSYLLPG